MSLTRQRRREGGRENRTEGRVRRVDGKVSPIESGRVADGDRLSFGDLELGTKDVRISCNRGYEYANAQAHRPLPGRQRERPMGWDGQRARHRPPGQ